MTRYYFKVTRKWRGFSNDMCFAFIVGADNIIGACCKAFKMVKRHVAKVADTHEHCFLVENEEAGTVALWDENRNYFVFAYTDFEIITEAEYNALECSKDFIK